MSYNTNACGSLAKNRLKSENNKELNKYFENISPNDDVKFFEDSGYKKLPILLSLSKQENKKPMRVISTFDDIEYMAVYRVIDSKERAKM